MKSCIYIGMASDDVDISQLVETIAITAREIEENSRVCTTNQGLIPFPGFGQKQTGAMKDKATRTDVCLSILSQEVLLPVSWALCQHQECHVDLTGSLPSGTPQASGGIDACGPVRRSALWLEGGGSQAFRKVHLLFDRVRRGFLGEAQS